MSCSVGERAGMPLAGAVSSATIPDSVERTMDEAGFETKHSTACPR